MSITFHPAQTGQAPIIVMIAGGTNTGKSWSSLLLARGMVGPAGKIAAVDTEGGRLSSLARYHKFDMAVMGPPFRPSRFSEYAETAEAEGYGAVLFDSGSMMHIGPGGYRDWHEQEVTRLSKGNEADRYKHEWSARRRPSEDRQAMLYALLQRRIPIIFSCRARELTENRNGKVVAVGWQPTIHKELIYDVTLSFTLRPEYGKGVIRHEQPYKLEKDHEAIFKDRDLITEDHGAKLIELMRAGESAPAYFAVRSDGKRIPFASFDGWLRWWEKPVESATPEQLKTLRAANKSLIEEYAAEHQGHIDELERSIERAISPPEQTETVENDPALEPA